jgi:membrane-bound lytic murein transglycosylase
LNREADFVLWKQKYDSYSMAYYAKSLTTDDNEKEAKYLAQACEGQTEEKSLGCRIAKAFESQQFEALYQSLTDEAVMSEGLLTDVLKYEIALKLDKTDEAEANFENLAQYNHLKPVRKYQLLEMLAEGDVVEENQRAPASVSDNEIEAYTKVKPEAEVPETQILKSQRHGKIMELLENL